MGLQYTNAALIMKRKFRKELTGIKILEYIKSLNKGIQVIITTASNKIWNYENSSNANGYILKQGSYAGPMVPALLILVSRISL